MKILHYSRFFSPVSHTFIYDLVLQLDALGTTNIFVADKLVNQIERPYKSSIELPLPNKSIFAKGWKKIIHYAGIQKYSHKADQLNSNRKHLKNICADIKPNVIHAHFGSHGYTIFPIAHDLHIPLIVSFHGFDAFKLPQNPAWLLKLQQVFKEATTITVVSEAMEKHLRGLGCCADKLKVIHVGKKLDDYPFLNKPAYPIKNFISIGRLNDKKGHDDCIRAFRLLSSTYPDLSLKIIGEGELRNSLLSMIKDAGLENRIMLLGSKTHDEVKEYLKNADAFILCSKAAPDGDQEGIPTVIMEAQLLGLPCISTYHSGIPEVVPPENYWMLAQEGSPQSIAQKIEELIAKPKNLLHEAVLLARRKTELEFSLNKETEKLLDLYHLALNKNYTCNNAY